MPERHGYSVRFSSVNPNLLIVASSQKYGRKGGGTLFLLTLAYNDELICLHSYEWTDGLFDVVSYYFVILCLKLKFIIFPIFFEGLV